MWHEAESLQEAETALQDIRDVKLKWKWDLIEIAINPGYGEHRKTIERAYTRGKRGELEKMSSGRHGPEWERICLGIALVDQI